uniref:Transposase MuDR plant domain-containing protein n=1 Tax=Lactuca sativa TaxID=4236 RepID=A0A9R1X549_LACSA|nr:hypothetical protein LSAT_V11C600308670 [Lactuca sativa]
MGFKEFILQLQKLTKESCIDVYYCLQNWFAVDGLRELREDNDYVRFLDDGYANDCKINVCIDEYQEPIMEWINEEKAEEGDTESDEYEDDVDSVMSDDISLDYELDEEVIPLKKSTDPFLAHTNVIPKGGVNDEDGDSIDEVYFSVHDLNQQWDTMKPVLGMKFCDRYELKKMIANYVVSNGYKLWLSYWKMKALVKTNFGLNVSVGQCRNARRFAWDDIEGSLVGHYVKIRNYGVKLLRVDLGSTVKIDIDNMSDSTMYFSKMYWEVTPSGPQQYEFRLLHEGYRVDLNNRTYACRSWQISGMPSLHATATILFLNGNVEDYVSVWFTKGMFGSCYRYTIKPINGVDLWPTIIVATIILPPIRRRLPGRPKVNRKKFTNEVLEEACVADEIEDHKEEYVADEVEDHEKEYVTDEVKTMKRSI